MKSLYLLPLFVLFLIPNAFAQTTDELNDAVETKDRNDDEEHVSYYEGYHSGLADGASIIRMVR